MLIVQQVVPGSPAARCGIKPGDRLWTIGGHRIRDIFDYQFHQNEASVRLTLKRDSRLIPATLSRKPGEQPGLSFKPFRYRRCGNRCVFCFVDQLPRGLRESLYFKDEDYRLSFLYGNYITGTNLSASDIRRIIALKLSPLYISVHCLDEKVRQRMLGNKRIPSITRVLQTLADGRIRMHTQVVVCPGINDAAVLDRTVRGLSEYWPWVRSIALIPVGLTRHRKGLFPLIPMSRNQARAWLNQVRIWQREFLEKRGTRLVFPADELFLKAGSAIPAAGYYEGFAQLDNGVGMASKMMDGARKIRFPVNKLKKITLITGEAAYPVIKAAISISGIDRKIKVVKIKNRFLGPTVTVSGLLAGRDIIRQLRGKRLGVGVLLPPNCLNDEGFFIDDHIVPDVEKGLMTPVYTSTYDLMGSILKTAC